ncbi:MAG: hypothetical protein A3I44_04740 [Candidatus Sungbacteria bacterium RIFCSPLOWO2_02_FULL_51_17]|uniref:Uncharacterized protein n=1 Tax=Candidatus Sungbacteria bacterium RIFCSPHIGHO2_02_FULL_51_29 TaxID=1802273 RepID=A0A1G2KU40_9BACT|nr:MAG: hypothetical protein A2676_05295 [Candidatus Sungbacteria bacterium RIFCSPHIGHO2_01_FULL_51_22]OHA02873.1 MAG: hypothetical protein A3C16_01565 [Candidatus Sungbacteria bacterium RIFCSPHIGHO2_02_FULL_51_29]OHA11595.1 MAG: hypothetical protein A3I44_04740 [Candidatus Sungbacteria bacterium RIFCSPLOWO2_02_FULL_51_17]
MAEGKKIYVLAEVYAEEFGQTTIIMASSDRNRVFGAVEEAHQRSRDVRRRMPDDGEGLKSTFVIAVFDDETGKHAIVNGKSEAYVFVESPDGTFTPVLIADIFCDYS